MNFKELFFALFAARAKKSERSQYYLEISIPQDRKKSRKIGYGEDVLSVLGGRYELRFRAAKPPALGVRRPTT